MRRDHRFSGRQFVSVGTAFLFVGVFVTGIMEFVKPPGRVAHWTGWRLFGLTKEQWEGLHIWFCIAFVVFSGFHVYFNWKALVSYFKNRLRNAFAARWEWVIALGLCAILCVGTIAEIPPFSSLMVAHETLKQSWERVEQRAPIPHAELLTLGELAEKTGMEQATLEANLQARGIVLSSPEKTVGELAAENDMTPYQLYTIAIGGAPGGRGKGKGKGKGGGGYGKTPMGSEQEGTPGGQRGGGGFGGRGLGRRTLAEYCTEAGLDLDRAVEALRDAGLEATGAMTLWDIADPAGLRPHDVLSVLEKK